MYLLIYLFESVKGERKRGKNTDVREKHRSIASYSAPNRDWARNPGMCPDSKLNQQPFAL